MSRLLDEIRVDLSFIKGHTLQPRWFKVLKVFILLGALLGYYALFGWARTVAFFAVFFSLMFLVHMAYRVNTKTWTQSWLDFVVVQEDGKPKARTIGKFYYLLIIINAVLSFIVSQVLF